MVSIEEAVISRMNVGGINFEVMVDPNKALDLKHGKKIDMQEVLAYPGIYRDVKKGMKVSDEELRSSFGTTDIWKIAEKIIKHGKLQLTTEQRRKFVEEKRMQIANIISRRGINPQTGAPHPVQRILTAMKQMGVNVEPFEDPELQIDRIIKEIKPLIPIKFQRLTIQIKIPGAYAGHVYSVLRESSTVVSEQWLNDGTLQTIVVIPGGIQDEFFSKIAKITKGDFESKIIKKEDV